MIWKCLHIKGIDFYFKKRPYIFKYKKLECYQDMQYCKCYKQQV